MPVDLYNILIQILQNVHEESVTVCVYNQTAYKYYNYGNTPTI